jgi:uncharacterized protein
MFIYQPPWYLRNGLLQTWLVNLWYGTTWRSWGDRVSWLDYLPKIPWQEHIFIGAEQVPLWGMWGCPVNAKGTLIVSIGLTGQVQNAWYAHILACKAYDQGWAVLLYDWRGHGRTAALSAVPSSYGWREGQDQVQIVEQLIEMGCPSRVVLVGFSLGGQLTLWGLKAATESRCDQILGGAVLSPNLESSRSLRYLRTTFAGKAIERAFVKNLRAEVKKQYQLSHNTIKDGALARIYSIDSFDQEMAIAYYGFANVNEYYEKTSGLYLLDKLTLPYLIIYAKDDPMYDPTLVPEIQERIGMNPHAHLILSDRGGHTAHIGIAKENEDKFWGANRLLDFCEWLLLQD